MQISHLSADFNFLFFFAECLDRPGRVTADHVISILLRHHLFKVSVEESVQPQCGDDNGFVLGWMSRGDRGIAALD